MFTRNQNKNQNAKNIQIHSNLLCASIFGSIYSTFSSATQDITQIKTAKGKKKDVRNKYF